MNLKVTNELKHFKTAQEINSNLSPKEKQKLQKAAKQFESLFTAMMLKSMTNNTEGLFGSNSYGGDYFNMIFQNAVASKISEGKGIGISDLIYNKLAEKQAIQEINKTESANSAQPSEKAQPAKGTPGKIDLKNHDQNFFSIPPSQSSLNRLNKYESIIDQASKTFNVDKNLVKSVILAESAANPKAVSKANAKGLMQLMDQTAQDMGVDNILDPKQNIFGGTKYLSQMLRLYNGDVNMALASYNAGPGTVEKYNGVPPFKETKNYINRVIGYLNHFNG